MTLPASTRRLSLLLAGALSVLLAAIPCAAAAATTRLAASVLGDVWGGHQAGGHGALLLAADLDGRHADGCIALDTETLRLGISGLHLSGGVSVGLDVVGELGFAGLLPDYYRDGTLDRGRGFAASYALAAPRLDFAARGQHFGSVVVGVRRWAFATLPATDAALELPPDTTVVELTGRYTLWRLRGGSDWVERQRRFPRVEGVALGAELGVHLRTDAAAWGARDPDVFAPPDLGNSPDGVIVRPRIWLRAGTRLPSGWRWQLSHVAGWGVGEDDLTGDRIGGLNPYSVPIAGAPWAGWVSSRFGAAEWSWLHPVGAAHELGVALQGALVDDLDRTGRSDADAVFGAAALADLRFGPWQVDARVGFSPPAGARSVGVGALVGVGVGGAVAR